MVDALRAAVSAGVSVVDLSHELRPGLPRGPVNPDFRLSAEGRHGDQIRADGLSFSHELIITGTHVGTHVDALSHVSRNGSVHGGHALEDVVVGGLFTIGDSSSIRPVVGRGVLLDVANTEGLEVLPGEFGVGADELSRAEAKAGASVVPGDVVVVRTGWAQKFGDADAFRGVSTGVPGLTVDGADWLAERGVVMAGCDTLAFEQILVSSSHSTLPVHGRLLLEEGIHIIEVLNLEELSARHVGEFTIVVAPLRFAGGSGAPARVLACIGQAP
jgi:kynurenine formamidase